ncbi:hypothetical protein ACPA9J_06205 [Pseudomonas aeruginosa]
MCNAELRVGERFAEETRRVPATGPACRFPASRRALAEIGRAPASPPAGGAGRHLAQGRKSLHLNPASRGPAAGELPAGRHGVALSLAQGAGRGALSTTEAPLRGAR